MSYPRLHIDLDRIEHNARTISRLLAAHDIQVAGVTKCVCGHPAVARAMLRGGVSAIADSRLQNLLRMRDAGVQSSFMLLRLPPLSALGQVVELATVSLNSELQVLSGLSQAAHSQDRLHDVIIMVELGDLREGVPAESLLATVRAALQLPAIRLRGLGANLACFAGVVPTVDSMNRLVELAEEVEGSFGIELDTLSAINSSGLTMIEAGTMPARINHARIGEAILLGRETVARRPWPGTHQDAFRLEAEVVELYDKPSAPTDRRSQNAFGDRPEFEDRGVIPHALLSLGRQDVHVPGLVPLDSRLRILGACSGYTALDLAAAADEYRVGDTISFTPDYAALLSAMSSQYVEKRPLQRRSL